MESVEFVAAVHITQAVFSLVLAGLLLMFLRVFGHRFLRHWAWSALAMAVYLAASMIGLHAVAVPDGDRLLRLGASTLSLVAGYLHVTWLLLGAWEAIANRSIHPARHVLLIGLAVAAGAGSVLLVPAAADSAEVRHLLRYSLLHAITGVAFLTAALMLLRSLMHSGLISASLVPLAFSLQGLHMAHVAGLSAWMTMTGRFQPYASYLGLVGFLLQVLIGYSIIIWLLEAERRRHTQARDKADSAEERLVHLRMHDATTGLPNRRQLQHQIAEAVRSTGGGTNRIGILAIGIHRFKLISQALGWHKTDELVRQLARHLQTELPANATLGRVGERDFIAVIPGPARPDALARRAQRWLSASSVPISVDGRDLFVELSGGLCVAPDDEIDSVALIKLAQQTQIQAAEHGETLRRHRAESNQQPAHDILRLEHELRRGVREGQFQLYFQPLVSIRARRITGFECLLRWQHPERGLLTPGSFMQEAVGLGVLDDLEDQIFEQALSQRAEWQNQLALPRLSVSINLSAQRFQDPELARKVGGLCRRFQVDPGDVHLEITESTAMQDFEAGLDTIGRLRELGACVCLDDFGTGYSSLAHLRRLKVDYIKLDRSFVKHLERDPRERELTGSIVSLIRSFGMGVLAEGVENREQLGYLIKARVDTVQGFLLGRPLPAREYLGALERPEIISL